MLDDVQMGKEKEGMDYKLVQDTLEKLMEATANL
jgi:hypothetical protein